MVIIIISNNNNNNSLLYSLFMGGGSLLVNIKKKKFTVFLSDLPLILIACKKHFNCLGDPCFQSSLSPNETDVRKGLKIEVRFFRLLTTLTYSYRLASPCLVDRHLALQSWIL